MPKFRLGAYKLPPGEVVLIRTLMRIFSQNPAFGWVFADGGPYDAIVIDSALLKPSETACPARFVLRLTSGNDAPSQHTLQRPIKAEKLQEWLKIAALELTPPNASANAPPHSLLAMPQARFKLRRWPPQALLQNNASLIRMSTLLSRRSLRLSELAELSQQSLDSCRLFIEKLLSMQLIACESMAPSAGSPFATLQPCPPAPAHMLYHGLLGGIRRRLGI
jgi:hypothetical protein